MIICTQFLLRLLGPSLGKNQGTMASADFLQFVVTAAFGFFPLLYVCKTSPGKSNNFPPM